VEQLQKSSAIPSTVVPAATTTQAFTNAADLARLNIAIQKIDNTTQAYKDALKNATETFKKNFEDQLTAGVYTDESSIQAILNPTTSNPIIKNYVDDIVKNTTSLI
jgi:glutamate-1-semialdehyde aminotransferase